MLSANAAKLAAATIIHVLGNRAIASDPNTEALQIDGAGHRVVFILADYLSGLNEDASDFIVSVIADLANELPVPSSGQAFSKELVRRAKG